MSESTIAPDAELARLREENAGLRALLDDMDAAVYSKDLQGRYVYANKAVQAVFGATLEQIRGKDDSAFFDLALSEELRTNDRQVMADGALVEREEHNVIKATGEKRTYWTVKRPVFDGTGRLLGMAGISTDITDRKRLEDELNYANIIVAESSTVLHLTLANESFEKVYTSSNVIRFGYSVEDARAGLFSFPDFVHEDDRPAVMASVQRMYDGTVDVIDMEYRLVTRDGSIRQVIDRTSAIRDESGVITHWQGSITDVSDVIDNRRAAQ
ncbi:unannotated protein [freshwater metagenome]|uniref:histidine kinase n=1 Tax=freshwater metagenome TaxID=449393 RepID=A0A6J7QS78_9ZZZZ|nr:PAS domain S-box protein [Actinomycetota bacterium]MSW37586.1 PAS domain S-box protein [Actinomycetota bacterium]